MANLFNTNKNAPGIIAKMAAGYLNDHIQFVKTIDKADESDWNGKNGYSAGDTIQVSRPAQLTYGVGADISAAIQGINETKTPLALTTQSRVAVEVTSAELATDIQLKSWAKRVLEPAMITLANGIEQAALTQAVLSVNNIVGTPGSTVFDTDTSLAAGQKMDESGLDDYANRFMLLNPAANRSAVNARKGLFQQSTAIAEQYKDGAIGMADGFTYLRNNLLPTFTMGTQNTTGVTVSANFTSGSGSVALAGLGNATTVTAGTVFTVAGIFNVHPVTKATLPTLAQFVVVTGGTASAGGALTVTVNIGGEVIFGSAAGGQQNVSALTASGQGVVFATGAASTGYAQNLAFHKSAFRFASVPLIMPDGVDFKAQETYEGITVRVIRDYIPTTDKLIMRCDVLWGMANVRPQFATRVTA